MAAASAPSPSFQAFLCGRGHRLAETVVAEQLGLSWGQGILSALSADLSHSAGLPSPSQVCVWMVCGSRPRLTFIWPGFQAG